MGKNWKVIIVYFMTAVFALILLYKASRITYVLPFDDYAFELMINPENFKIHDFHLFFDFNSQSGKLEFETSGEGNVSYIEFVIPEELIFESYDILNESGYSIKEDVEAVFPTSHWIDKQPMIRKRLFWLK